MFLLFGVVVDDVARVGVMYISVNVVFVMCAVVALCRWYCGVLLCDVC